MKIPKFVIPFTKHLLNPFTKKIAGASHSPFAKIFHVGRRSGKTYETPLIVQGAQDEFIFALTYGEDVDWYQNVLSAGHCRLRWNAKDYELKNPQSLDVNMALSAFPLLERMVLKLIGIQHFFGMKITESPHH